MTKDEALKLALEALCKMIPCDDVCDCTGQRAITAIKEALAQPAQEPDRQELQANGTHPAPCARHCEAQAFKVEIRNLKAQLAQPTQEMVATMTVEDGRISFAAKILPDGTYDLYTAPPTAQPAQEPVGSLSVRYFRGAKSMTNTDFDYNGDLPEGDYELYTTPPQRPWVGLTDDEIEKGREQAFRWAEAALKEQHK